MSPNSGDRCFPEKRVVSYQNTHPLRQTSLNSTPSKSEISIQFASLSSSFYSSSQIFSSVSSSKISSIMKKVLNKMFSPHLFRIFVSEKSPRSRTKSADLMTPTPYKSHLCCIRADASSLPALRLRSGSNSSDLRKRQVRKVTDNAVVTSVFCRINRFDIFFRVRHPVTLSDIRKTFSVNTPIVKLKLQRCFQEGNNSIQNKPYTL